MNTLTTYVPGHFSSTERVFRQLPALFNDNWLDKVFGEVDKAFDVPNAVYPYNVLVVRDGKQEITQYEVEVALAGIGKEHIDVKVRDGQLRIEVQKEETKNEVSYLRKGISHRKGSMTFNLDEKVNCKKINSSYKDGLLRVVIPVKQPETYDIDIEVK